MAYSIETKDGIVINNIPDNVAKDDPSLKARVAEIRASRVSEESPNIPGQVTRPPQPEQERTLGQAAIGADR